MQIIHLLPQIDILLNLVSDDTIKKKQKFRGVQSHDLTNHKTLLTDSQVIEARGLHEYQGWRTKRLAEKFGTTNVYMRNLLSYKTRSNSRLIPKAKDFGRSL